MGTRENPLTSSPLGKLDSMAGNGDYNSCSIYVTESMSMENVWTIRSRSIVTNSSPAGGYKTRVFELPLEVVEPVQFEARARRENNRHRKLFFHSARIFPENISRGISARLAWRLSFADIG